MLKRTLVMATALWFGMACAVGGLAQGREVFLGGPGVDMEVDAARQRLYVSVPSRNQIVVISTETYEVVERITVGTGPRGIDISIDGSLLFVALDGASSVVFLDLETFKFSQVVIGAELGSARAWDVIEGRPGRVFASAFEFYNSQAVPRIVMINRDANNAATRVADGKSIPGAVFAGSPDRDALYVGGSVLHKLDISETQDSGPTAGRIILRSDHSAVSGTIKLAVSPDGNIIYTATGQALRTDSFIQVGRLALPGYPAVHIGVPRVSEDGALVYVAQAPDTIAVYETTTYTLVGSVTTPCWMSSVQAFDILPNGEDYVILADDILCAGTLNVEADVPPTGLLGGPGADMEVDAARQRLYVSVPSRNQIVVISTETYEVVERITVGTGPRGIDISIDGSLLFVALDGASSVVFLDLETFKFSQVVIGAELGSARTWDVIEGRPGRVFASANISGPSYIVMINRDANNAATRVADGPISSGGPVFADSPDRNALYVGAGVLHKLDISETPDSGPTAGRIILRTFFAGETHKLAVSTDGNIIYTATGQALRTDSFIQVGRLALPGYPAVPIGVPRLSEDGALVYVAQAPDTISVYETTTYTLVGSVTTPCKMSSVQAFDILPNGEDYVILADDSICMGTLEVQSSVPPTGLLGGLGVDMEVDAARQRLYVSVPSRNQIVVISTETYEVIERITVGTGPRGIDISIDGSLLFVALDGGSSVVFLDLETFSFSQVVIGAELGSARTWDVIEGRPGRVFASAIQGGGPAYIAMINRDANNAATRVADGRIISSGPVFAGSPDQAAVYIGEGISSSTDSLYKLDISETPDSGPTAGRIILRNVFGSVSGTDKLAVSPDGNFIYTGSGQVLRTNSFIQVGRVGRGVPRVSDDGSLVYVAQVPDKISVYETATYSLVGSITTSCRMSSIQVFDILPNGEDYVILADESVCMGTLEVQSSVPPTGLLGGLGVDMEVDAARQRLYVSVPSRNQVVVISTETYEVIERITVGTGPRGIDISIDGSLLFVALYGGSSVAFLDLETFSFSQVVIGAELGSAGTWDVIEGRPGRVFASARNAGTRFYIVMINRDANNAPTRVADSIAAERPVFASSPDQAAVYVGAGYPASLYKLDISETPDMSATEGRIILRNVHGPVSGTDKLAVSPDGNFIYTGSGQVLRTDSFIQVGRVGEGVPRVSNDGSLVYVAQVPDKISVYETATYSLVGSITTSCRMSSIQVFDILPNGEDYVILADDILCTGSLTRTDRVALEALYDALYGSVVWTNSTNWKTAAPLSEWYGVTTDAAGRVTKLDLSGNELKGSIPESLAGLSNLQQLNLRDNALTGPIPEVLRILSNLQVLDLSENVLAGPVPAWLRNLSNLRELYLGFNELRGPIPESLGSLSNLQVLVLSYNWDVSGPLPASLRLPHLRVLDIGVTQACAPPTAWWDWARTIDFFLGALCGVEADVTIDVAVVYTPAAREAAGGTAAIETEIDLMIAETNAAYTASGVRHRVALAGRSEVPYTETGDSYIDLDRLRDPGDGHMDGVHAMRDRTGADLLHLIFKRGSDVAVLALAELGGPFGLTCQGCGGDVFAHETGHNIGLLHDRYAERRLGKTLLPHPAYGYVNHRAFAAGAPSSSAWITIMAFNAQCAEAGKSCSRLLRFSNPRQTWMGDRLGVHVDSRAQRVSGPADAVAVLNAMGPAVAAWRGGVPDVANPQAVGTESFSIPDRGGRSITSSGTAESLRVGYGRIRADEGSTTPFGIAIFGFRQNGVLISEAGVPASEPVQEGRIFAEVNGPINTGLAIANPNDGPAFIQFYFTDTSGTRFAEGSFELGAHHQTAKFLDQPPFNGGSSVLGALTFTASVPVAVIALRGLTNEAGEFLMTTLPVAPLSSTSSDTVYFPHFADGGGWATQIILVNPTDSTILGTAVFLGPGSDTAAASPVVLTLDDGRTGSDFDYSIAPRSSQRFTTSNPPGGWAVGSVRATPDSGNAAPSGLVVFSFTSGGKTVLEAGVPALPKRSAFRVYVEAAGTPGQAGSIRSGLAIANTADTANTVTLEVTRLDGSLAVPPATLALPPSGQIARFLDEIFALPDNFSGVGRVTSTAEVAIVGLRLRVNERGELKVTTTPPSNETGPTTMVEKFFPHIADSGGWSTQFILYSGAAGQAASGTLRFIDASGQPLDLPITQP